MPELSRPIGSSPTYHLVIFREVLFRRSIDLVIIFSMNVQICLVTLHYRGEPNLLGSFSLELLPLLASSSSIRYYSIGRGYTVRVRSLLWLRLFCF